MLSDNLVSYWQFDESSGDTYDALGVYTGTLTNATYTTGKINNGVAFDGTAYITFNDGSATKATTQLTVSCWVKVNNFDKNMNLFYRANGNSLYPRAWIRTTGTIAFQYKIDTITKSVDAVSVITDTNWHFIVCVMDIVNFGTRVYVDGEMKIEGSTHLGSNIDSSTNATRIGYDSNGGYYMDGVMDEIGIWNRALTEPEIVQLYNSGTGFQYPFARKAVGINTITGATSITI